MAVVDLTELEGEHEGSGTERAAILMAALDETVAINLLKKLEPRSVQQLLEASAQLRPLKHADVDPVVDAFAKDVSDALGIEAGPDQLMALLESAFTGEEIANILGKPKSKPRENVWQKLTVGQVQIVVPYLLDQHEQVAAYVLSRLDPELSARCVAMCPRSTRNRLAQRMISIEAAYAPAVELLEEVLLEDLFGSSNKQKSTSGRNFLAAVINKLDREKSVEVLEDLAKSSPSEMSELRKLIFMFEDIQLLEEKGRMKFIDRVPTELIISALFGMDQSFREVILSSMSARSRRLVESELQGDTSQPNKDTLAARRKIADIAILMSQKGELELPVFEQGGDDKDVVGDESPKAA